VQSVLSFSLGGGEREADLVPVISPLLQCIAAANGFWRARRGNNGPCVCVAGAERVGAAEKGLQKALESDEWVSTGSPTEIGAWLVLDLRVGLLGWMGTWSRGVPWSRSPLWGLSLRSLPCMGMLCHWLLCLQGRQPLPGPQAAPFLLLCCFRDQEGNSYFPGGGEERSS